MTKHLRPRDLFATADRRAATSALAELAIARDTLGQAVKLNARGTRAVLQRITNAMLLLEAFAPQQARDEEE
jgi:hypothetical protein